jgi:hypothetical protein
VASGSSRTGSEMLLKMCYEIIYVTSKSFSSGSKSGFSLSHLVLVSVAELRCLDMALDYSNSLISRLMT